MREGGSRGGREIDSEGGMERREGDSEGERRKGRLKTR